VACLGAGALAPEQLQTWPAMASLMVVAVGLCLILTDAFFLNVRTVACTGETVREQPNLALTVLKYFTFFPAVVWIPVALQPWIGANVPHFATAGAVIAVTHIGLERIHRRIVREHCKTPGLEQDEEDFPMKLGLRY
jgi:hypothetical protein